MPMENILATPIEALAANKAVLAIGGRNGAGVLAAVLGMNGFQAHYVRRLEDSQGINELWAARNTELFHVLIADTGIGEEAINTLRDQARNGEIKGLSPHATIERSDQMPQVISRNTGNRGRDYFINFVVRMRMSLVECHLRDKGEPVPADLPQAVIKAYGTHIRISQFGEPHSERAAP